MTILYPVNGKNERLGELFETPKHLLLYEGQAAIKRSIYYMRDRFPEAYIKILCNERYYKGMGEFQYICQIVPDTDSQVETIRLAEVQGSVMIVDCDIVPLEINDPKGNTVYLFENKEWLKQYSNFSISEGEVTDCNEKGDFLPWAGSGLYHFEDFKEFKEKSEGCRSVSEVVKKCKFKGDTESKVFRFGTLNDIKNDEQLTNRIY